MRFISAILITLSRPAPHASQCFGLKSRAAALCLACLLFCYPALAERVNLRIAWDNAATEGVTVGIRIEPFRPAWIDSTNIILGEVVTRSSKTSPITITNIVGSSSTNLANYKITFTGGLKTEYWIHVPATNCNAEDIRIAAPSSTSVGNVGFFLSGVIKTNGTSIGTTATAIDFTAGVTGYVSGATAKLGVSSSAGSADLSVTNALTRRADFDLTQFATNGAITIKSGASVTNVTMRGATMRDTIELLNTLKVYDATIIQHDNGSLTANFNFNNPATNTLARLWDVLVLSNTVNTVAADLDEVAFSVTDLQNSTNGLNTSVGNLRGATNGLHSLKLGKTNDTAQAITIGGLVRVPLLTNYTRLVFEGDSLLLCGGHVTHATWLRTGFQHVQAQAGVSKIGRAHV